jgi:hypothetical protein
MKKFFYVLAASSFMMACNTEAPKTETATTVAPAAVTVSDVKAEVPLPMTPSYSNSFELGKSEYAAMIVQGSWKDWDDNKLDNMTNWLADTVVAIGSDMNTIRGAANVMKIWKAERAKYTEVLDTINAVIPIYAKDKNEHWVMVWATSNSTDLKGKKTTAAYMETWRINKDGKADLLLQFDRAIRKK